MKPQTSLQERRKILDEINSIIKHYDPELKQRAIALLLDAALPAATHVRPETTATVSATTANKWDDCGALYDAARPSTQEERALVAGYYFQFVQNKQDLRAQELNTALKDLGRGVDNITQAIQGNIDYTPSLMRQIKKSGTSRQARKLYRLTEAGKQRVLVMLGETES